MSISDDIDLRMEVLDRAERIMDYADEEADWATACQIARTELAPHSYGSLASARRASSQGDAG